VVINCSRLIYGRQHRVPVDTFVRNYDRKRVPMERKGAIPFLPFHLVSCQDASPVLMLVGV
jgi:hypothetical protein